VIGAIVHVSTESPSDGAGKPSLMAGKNNDSTILRTTQIIVEPSSADSHFLPFTHDPRHDSGGRARRDN
jgi:hypothetical protein